VNRTPNYVSLPTEQPNPHTRRIDQAPLSKVIDLIFQQDRQIPQALKGAREGIARAVELMTKALEKNGRLFFVGAGTSGRLGVMEAAECPPTFNTSPQMVQAIMAGGRRAVFRSQEGAEDRAGEARREVSKRVRKGDVVVGIAASGVTPFVQAALTQAKRQKAKTILVTCNPTLTPHPDPLPKGRGKSMSLSLQGEGLRMRVDVLIAVNPGPEVISGSTRMKAGTCTKIILNTLTTASMIRLGKVYGHWMVDLQPKSQKLRARALRLVSQLGNVDAKEASRLLKAAWGQAKTAILMARKRLDYKEATQRLQEADGFLRKTLE
jgi:N-acetylmuramic acid 6-phosphate etherase